MLNVFSHFRVIALLLASAFIAACTQTGTQSGTASSTFSGRLTDDLSEKKILAARKRAKLKREADRKAFRKKREERREARLSKRGSSAKKSIFDRNKKTAKKSKTSKTTVTSRGRSNKKQVGKVVKVGLAAIHGTAYARVRGRSKGIHRSGKRWNCVPKRLKIVLAQVSRKFGRVVINSTHRSHRHNRRVGGKRRSYHLRCQAVDFRVHGQTRGLTRWLANHPYVGGYNRYPSGYYHIDTGPKRTW